MSENKLVLIDFCAARRENISKTRSMTVVFKRGYSPEEQYRTREKQWAFVNKDVIIQEGSKMEKKDSTAYGICGSQPVQQPVVKSAKIYPNDLCPCGSGKKYKKCCKRK